jgi:DNA polymerase III epsilon subunit-like protein
MVRQAWEMLDEADAVVGYNSKSFDMKHLNREFVLAGYPPPPPYTDIDLMNVVKQTLPLHQQQVTACLHRVGHRFQTSARWV